MPHKLTWRSQHLPLSGIIIVSDYFGGGTWKKLYLFTLFSELAKIIKIQYKQQVKLVDYTQYIKESVVPDEDDAVMIRSQ